MAPASPASSTSSLPDINEISAVAAKASSSKTKKSKDKGKKKATDEPRNEGVDQNWAYKPPAGAKLLEFDGDAGEFDWDNFAQNDDLELWVIRVPNDLKSKYLEGTEISLPPAPKTIKAATVSRKSAKYDVWSLGNDDNTQVIGGEEIKSLSCLLPRKSKKGKLYKAPRPFARHLVVTAQPPEPSTESSGTAAITGPYPQPPRESYDEDALTHSFKPYGSLADDTEEVDEGAMEVDEDISVAKPEKPVSKSKTKTKAKEAPPSPGKKTPKEKKKKGEEVVLLEKENLNGAATGDGPDAGVMDVDDSVEVPLTEDTAVPKVESTEKKGKKRKGEEVVPAKPKKSKKAKTS